MTCEELQKARDAKTAELALARSELATLQGKRAAAEEQLHSLEDAAAVVKSRRTLEQIEAELAAVNNKVARMAVEAADLEERRYQVEHEEALAEQVLAEARFSELDKKAREAVADARQAAQTLAGVEARALGLQYVSSTWHHAERPRYISGLMNGARQ